MQCAPFLSGHLRSEHFKVRKLYKGEDKECWYGSQEIYSILFSAFSLNHGLTGNLVSLAGERGN